MYRFTDETIRCDGCGIELTGDIWIVDHSIYCCQDCSQGLKCSCGDRLDQEDDYRGSSGAPETYIV